MVAWMALLGPLAVLYGLHLAGELDVVAPRASK